MGLRTDLLLKKTEPLSEGGGVITPDDGAHNWENDGKSALSWRLNASVPTSVSPSVSMRESRDRPSQSAAEYPVRVTHPMFTCTIRLSL